MTERRVCELCGADKRPIRADGEVYYLCPAHDLSPAR
jgi:hypothetical protein